MAEAQEKAAVVSAAFLRASGMT